VTEGLTLAAAALAGFGLGVGLVTGAGLVRLIRRALRDIEDGTKPARLSADKPPKHL
jgi:ABC-type branched-subunit amino acid transport system permease subunit